MTVSKHTMLFSVFIIRDFTSWQNSAYIKYLRNYGYMSSKNCIDSIIECRYQILDDELFINAMILDFGYPGIIKSIWQPNYNYLQESPSRSCFFNILNSTRSKTFSFLHFWLLFVHESFSQPGIAGLSLLARHVFCQFKVCDFITWQFNRSLHSMRFQ